MVFPGADWAEASPESQGVDQARLVQAMNYLDTSAGGVGASEAMVIRNGYVIWKGSDIQNVHPVFSVTKTFTSTVLGILTDEGKTTLETPAVHHNPKLGEQYPTYTRIKMRHLASMTSGYDGEQGSPLTYLNPIAPLFDPGTKFKYHDPAVCQLGYILTQIAGRPLETVFGEKIAEKIGMTGWTWDQSGDIGGIIFNNPSGTPPESGGNGGISISAAQLARYAHLYLNRGNWDGKQLLSSGWIAKATANQVPSSLPRIGYDATGRYGFMWWTNGLKRSGNRPWPSAPAGTYTARGHSSNFSFVIPEWNMVIVRMEPTVEIDDVDGLWEYFFSILAPGILK